MMRSVPRALPAIAGVAFGLLLVAPVQAASNAAGPSLDDAVLALPGADDDLAALATDAVAESPTSELGTCPPVKKGDMNQDGKVDLVYRNINTNRHMVWTMDGITRTASVWVNPDPASADWQAVATDDFDSATSPGAGPDGKSDLVYYNTVTGAVEFWLMNANNRVGAAVPLTGGATLPTNWKLAATGDFNADGKPDILWRNTTSQKLVIWVMNGTAKTGNIIPTPDQAVDANWQVVAAVDLNNDGTRDLLWYNDTSGKIVEWTMNASVVRITGFFTTPANAGDNNWKVYAAGDFGVGSGGVSCSNDIIWRNATSGNNVCWYMDFSGVRTNGVFTIPASPTVDPDANPTSATDWQLVGPK